LPPVPPTRILAAARRNADARPLAAVVAVFAASRVCVALLGFRFDTRGLPHAVQNVDPELLRTHLLQSIWYLHGQPPLWNLFEGLVLKLAPHSWAAVFHALYLGLGLVEAVALYLLVAGLGVDRRWAAALACFFTVTPAVLVYENLLFYDYPTLVMLTAAALALQLFARRPTLGRALAFFALGATLVLTRTLFQIGWLLIALVALLIVFPRNRRTLLLGCALPVLVLVAVYAKNWAIFGAPATSSWTGMGLARVAEATVPEDVRLRLVREHRLHRVSLAPPLSSLAAYRAVGAVERIEHKGVPILDRPRKTTDRRNLHNIAYIRISRQYLSDDLWLIRHRPRDYLHALKLAVSRFLWPPTFTYGLKANTDRIHAWDYVFSLVFYGSSSHANRTGFVLLLAYALAVLFGGVVALRRLRPGVDGRTVTVLFAWWSIVYVGVVGNLSEYGENYRFRLLLDPLVLALLAAFGQEVARRRRGARERSPRAPRPPSRRLRSRSRVGRPSATPTPW
jgi:hypothetical protein